MTATLDDYQLTAARAMAASPRFLLADPPGAGKTYPAIEAASTVPGRKLVICPAHLQHQWTIAIREMGYSAVIPTGSPRKKRATITDTPEDIWLVTSYHLLGSRKDKAWRYRELQGPWGAVIFDEAHALRNPKNGWTRAAFALRAQAIYLLTGTPEIGNSGDWYSMAKILGRLDHSSYWKFVKRHCEHQMGRFGIEIGGLKHPEAFHSSVLNGCYLRRQLADLGIDVGKPIEHEIHLRLDGPAQKVHAKARKEYRKHDDTPMFDAAAVCHYLRRVSSWPPAGKNPKLQSVCHVLEKHNREKAVILTWYRHSRDRLAEHVSKNFKRQVFVVRAEDPRPVQRLAVDSWKLSPNGTLVGTLPHLKEGLDGLQAAQVLILFEQSHLAAENDQAVARLLRRGQRGKEVHIYRPVVDRTFDAAVARNAATRKARSLRDLLEEV